MTWQFRKSFVSLFSFSVCCLVCCCWKKKRMDGEGEGERRGEKRKDNSLKRKAQSDGSFQDTKRVRKEEEGDGEMDDVAEAEEKREKKEKGEEDDGEEEEKREKKEKKEKGKNEFRVQGMGNIFRIGSWPREEEEVIVCSTFFSFFFFFSSFFSAELYFFSSTFVSFFFLKEEPNPLFIAAEEGDVHIVEQILKEKEGDVNFQRKVLFLLHLHIFFLVGNLIFSFFFSIIVLSKEYILSQ